MRRDRAFTQGPELFLHERVFDDCLERIALTRRQFQSCLLIGCLDPRWPKRLQPLAKSVQVADPGHRFAEKANGFVIIEDEWSPPSSNQFDLCIAIGTLDSVNDLPRALQAIRASLTSGAVLIGAVAGGESLPRLRIAMHAADQVMGASSPHLHPRIEPSSLAPLLTACGFIMPVIDVDRVQISYRSFDQLIKDLRGMGATNILKSRSRRPLSPSAKAVAAEAFKAEHSDRTIETFEIIHFAAWTQLD